MMGRGGVEFILVFKLNSCSCQSHIHPWLRRPDHLTHPSWWISGPVQTTLLGTRSAPATCPHTWESGGGDLISLFCPGQLISHWSSIFYYNGTLRSMKEHIWEMSYIATQSAEMPASPSSESTIQNYSQSWFRISFVFNHQDWARNEFWTDRRINNSLSMVLKELTKDQNTLFPSQTHIFPIWTSLALSGFFKAWAESMQAFLRPNFLPNARHILLILLILGPELKPEVALFLHSISIKIVSVVDVKIFKTQEMSAILALKVI